MYSAFYLLSICLLKKIYYVLPLNTIDVKIVCEKEKYDMNMKERKVCTRIKRQYFSIQQLFSFCVALDLAKIRRKNTVFIQNITSMHIAEDEFQFIDKRRIENEYCTCTCFFLYKKWNISIRLGN